jgi:ATP synthase protein I
MDPWVDKDDADSWKNKPIEPLTREQAQGLSKRLRSVTPWQVVAAQAGVALVVALLAGLVTQSMAGAWSALWGAAAVVVPGALMARGATSKLSSVSPAVSAVSLMVWEMVKIATAVALLMQAPRWVQGLNWPALLAGLTICTMVYAFALVWRKPGIGEVRT